MATKTILAIDDTEKILMIVRHFLEGEGYSVLTASDPKEGLRIAQTAKVHLVLLDIMMPGMDGYTVCDKLKQNPKTRDIPVVMLTARAIILHTPKDFFYGLYGFLAKPFTKDQLIGMVKEVFKVTKMGDSSHFLKGVDPKDKGEITS